MSFKKRMKKAVGKVAKFALPGIGGKIIGSKLFGDKDKDSGPGGPVPETDQEALDREMREYGEIGKKVRTQLGETARRAGTYSDNAQFNESLEGEAAPVERFKKEEAQKRVNELRKRLGLPESAPGTI